MGMSYLLLMSSVRMAMWANWWVRTASKFGSCSVDTMTMVPLPASPQLPGNVIARYVLIRQVIIKDAVVLALARRQYDPVPVFEIAEEGGDVVVGAFAPGPTRSGP